MKPTLRYKKSRSNTSLFVKWSGLILFLFLVSGGSYGQILTFEFAGLSGNETTATSNFNNINLNTSTISRGAGLKSSGNADRFNATEWSIISIANAVTENKYMEFTINPVTGYQFNISSIVMQWQRSGTGTTAIALRSSADGYLTNLDAVKNVVDDTNTQFFTFIFTQSNSSSAITYRVYSYAEATGGSGGPGDGTGNDIVINGTVTTAGKTSQTSGHWNNPLTWTPIGIPFATDNVTILDTHTVTMTSAETRDLGTTTTVNTGGTLTVNDTYNNNGTTTINGTFQLNNGGSVAGNNLKYAATGSTLVFNNGSTYDINSGQVWPTTFSPYNVTINSGSGANVNIAVGSIPENGTLSLYGGLNLVNNPVNINGILLINSGGYLNSQSPNYGINSLLKYNTSNAALDAYKRSFEWKTTSGAGYPANVQVSGNTFINYPNTVGAFTTNLVIAKNLTIDSGSGLYMDYGEANNRSGSLTVGGNVIINGDLSLGNASGGDLIIAGNWTKGVGTFSPNNRAVFFRGTLAQIITGATSFDYLTIDKTGTGNVALSANIIVNKNLVLTSRNIVLGIYNLTLPNKTSTVTASATSYITANGTGKFIRQGIDGSGDWLFPVGVANTTTSRYAPITFKNLPGTRQIGVRATESFSPLTAITSQTLKTQWIVAADIATSPLTIATGWQSADLGSSMSFTPPTLGEIGIAPVTLPYNLYDASLNSNSTEVNTLSLEAGNNAVVVGLKNAIKIPNDECADAITLTVNIGTSCTSTTSGNLLTASQSITPINCPSITSSTALDIWYKFTATSISHIISVTPASSFDAIIDVRSGGCNGTTIGCADAFGSTTTAEKVALNTLTAGVEYYIRVYEYNGTAATSKPFTICVTEGPIPTMTLAGTPSLFTYAQDQGPSVHQTVIVSGANLASDITITAPNTNWEISTTSTFNTPTLPNTSSSIVLTKSVSNTVGNNNIHIRLKAGLVQGQYEFFTENDLVVSSFNATTKNADLDGEVTAPVAVINVEGNIGSFPDITSVTNTPLGTDNTLFGQQTLGTSLTKSYRIQNLGGLPLTISAIVIGGVNNLDFSIVNPPIFPLVISANSMTVFEVQFNPNTTGERNATVNITNNSSNVSPQFSFNIRGTGTNAEIDITGNGILIPTGSTIISAANFTFVGIANGSATNPTTVSKNFIVNNSGNVSLSISGITIIGADSNQFSVSPTTTMIAAGASRTITVTFAPTSFGVKNAVISIGNNDVTNNENPYTFAVQGKGVNFVVCAPVEQIIYQTGFESSEGFVMTFNGGFPFYQNTNYSTGGATTKWVTTYGTPTTSQPLINGGQSMQMRLYTNGEIGSTYTNFNLSDVKRVEFLARSKDGILSVEVSHSLNNGISWILPEFFPLSDIVQSLVYNVNSTPGSNVRIKFKVVGIPPDSDSKKLVIDDVVVYKGFENIKTWNGNAWSGAGSPAAPTASQKAIITGMYNSATNGGDISACECEVTSTGAIIMDENHTLDIQGAIINNGIINILDSASLVQRDDSAINSGTIGMERITKSMFRYDYTYWSSPVGSGFTLNDLSPNTLPNKYFKWNASTATWQVIQNGNEAMVVGKGYIVRAPQTFAVEGAGLATAYTANFIGKPNNGEVTIPVTRSSTVNKWNLIGNPYPSAINAYAFLSLNAPTVNPTLGGTLYFWTHNTGIGTVGSTYSYNPSDYASWNDVGGTATNPNNPTNKPDGKIAAGQGFFVRGIGNGEGSAVFNNSMRIEGDNNQFFKSSNTVEKHRVWLNMKGTTKGFSQTLVGYATDATNGLDNRFDGETFGGNQVTFYSMLDTKALVIQGRALPFIDSDTVPLGYKSTITENISIGIDHFDGLFDNQNIYLEDTNLNIIHNLKTSDYTFAAVPGTFNSRFILRYLPEEVLSNPTFDQQLQSVIIRKNDDIIRVNSPYELIQTVWVYDLMGRLIFEQINCNTNVFETNKITQKNQTLIVKVRLNNGGVVTGKL